MKSEQLKRDCETIERNIPCGKDISWQYRRMAEALDEIRKRAALIGQMRLTESQCARALKRFEEGGK